MKIRSNVTTTAINTPPPFLPSDISNLNQNPSKFILSNSMMESTGTRITTRDRAAAFLTTLLLLTILTTSDAVSGAKKLPTTDLKFGRFDGASNSIFTAIEPATISNGALQITPDTAHDDFPLTHRSGRVLYNTRFKIFDDENVISFNSSFFISIYCPDNSSIPGEGLSFILSPNLLLPQNSSGGFLGLTNSSSDGNSTNQIVAVELDTFKQDYDIDSNHIGINVNSVKSVNSTSLTSLGIELPANNYSVWVDYDGDSKILTAYIANETADKPSTPAISASIDLRLVLAQYSYFGFAASTGNTVELNCVTGWNITAALLPEKTETTPWKIELGIGSCVGVSVISVLLVFGFYLRKKWVEKSDPQILGTLRSLPGTPREFEFSELRKATNNFDESRKLGEGGFGVVYRGVLAKEGIEIAVKKFSRDDIKGKDDFLAELTIINRLRHKNLVKLLGWCHKNGMLLLVYEFMPNGSLDNHLFSGPEKGTLGWNLRYKIVTGIASALHYLHREYDPTVVHRDLKASNILLASNFDAQLGDFGLARALENEKTSYAELEGMPGTMGYIAPECLHTGRASCESDVYGFGAVLLEIVCGQRPWTKIAGFQLLVDWVWKLHQEDRILEAVDKRLGNDYVIEDAKRLLLLGLACSHPVPISRPKTQAIVQIISGSVPVPLVPPFKPSFVWPSPAPLDYDSDTTPMTSSLYERE